MRIGIGIGIGILGGLLGALVRKAGSFQSVSLPSGASSFLRDRVLVCTF